MVDVHENTSFVLEDNYRYGDNEVVIVFLLLMIVLKHHWFNTDINRNNHFNKHKVKYIITACIPIVIIKKFLLYFFTVYKNERKEHKF